MLLELGFDLGVLLLDFGFGDEVLFYLDDWRGLDWLVFRCWKDAASWLGLYLYASMFRRGDFQVQPEIRFVAFSSARARYRHCGFFFRPFFSFVVFKDAWTFGGDVGK